MSEPDLTPPHLNASIMLQFLDCDSAQESSGDEPYMINVFFMVDGSNSTIGPDFKVTTNPTVFASAGGNDNLEIPGEKQAKDDGTFAGDRIAIPGNVGFCSFWPFQRMRLPHPCDQLYQLNGVPGMGQIGVISLVLEEDSVADDAIFAGKAAAASTVRAVIKEVVEAIEPPHFEVPDGDELKTRYRDRIADAIKAAMKDEMNLAEKIAAKAGPDEPIGVFVKAWSFDELHQKRLWQEFVAVLDESGRYRLSGWACAMPQFMAEARAKKGDPPRLGMEK